MGFVEERGVGCARTIREDTGVEIQMHWNVKRHSRRYVPSAGVEQYSFYWHHRSQFGRQLERASLAPLHPSCSHGTAKSALQEALAIIAWLDTGQTKKRKAQK